jgi:hypothetical protein
MPFFVLPWVPLGRFAGPKHRQTRPWRASTGHQRDDLQVACSGEDEGVVRTKL